MIRVGVGVVGCGKIAQVRHIPEYIKNANAKIVGYYDFDIERASSIGTQYGGKAYKSVEELLGDPTIDAVSVCVANHAHAEISIKALKSGKHVLCEKPMAMSQEECYEMVESAKENGKLLMIGQNQRFTKTHLKAKELLGSGIIGEVLTYRTAFGHAGPESWSVDGGKNSWFFDKKLAGMGVMADLGVHKTDLIQFLLNQRVVETSAVITTLDKKDSEGNLISVDDNAICTYKMENGIVGTMTASWTYYGAEENSTILYGTSGIMKIYADPAYSIEVIAKSGERTLYEIDQIQTNRNQTRSGIIDAFVNAIINNQEPEASGKDVLNAMNAVFASIESSKQGKRLEVK